MSKDADGTAVGLLFDSQNRLTGHAKLRWVDDASGSDSGTDESAPDVSRLVPIALVAVAGIAAGVAGVKIAQNRKRRRQEERPSIVASAAPAGWYDVASDPTRLRYWDGAAWTDGYAQRAGAAPAIAADWYPDPADTAQLRYWDGSAWTHHVSRRPGAVATPAGWYPDPSYAAQLRYWDGTAWSSHVAAGPGAAVAVHRADETPSNARLAPAEPRINMSSAEWQAHVSA